MDAPTALQMDALTDIGLHRRNNEDAWWIGQVGGEGRSMEPGPAPLRAALGRGCTPALLLVCDGMGGASAGEVASQMAVAHVVRELARTAARLRTSAGAQGAILSALKRANEAIGARAAEPGCEGMGTTLSLLCFTGGGEAFWGQAGDSRIYVCRGGRLRQISRDHSPVGRLRQSGRISEADARRHPRRNQIDQHLGAPPGEFEPDIGAEAIRPGDVYLVCSDGLSDGLWDREIEEMLGAMRSPEHVRPAAQGLIARAKAASGRDNLTAAVALVI